MGSRDDKNTGQREIPDRFKANRDFVGEASRRSREWQLQQDLAEYDARKRR